MFVLCSEKNKINGNSYIRKEVLEKGHLVLQRCSILWSKYKINEASGFNESVKPIEAAFISFCSVFKAKYKKRKVVAKLTLHFGKIVHFAN
jgi:hypothetical protein